MSTFPRVPALPTFWEFVQFVLRTHSDPSGGGRHDEHWAPQLSLCPLCATRVDYLVRFEHLVEEEPLLEEALGIRDRLGGRLETTNANGARSDEETTRIYFETLDLPDVWGLYQMYEWDFRALGYEFEFRGAKFPPVVPD